MMISFSFKRALLVCGALGAVLTAGQIARAESNFDDAATVTRVSGEARVSLDQKTWQKLKKGMLLKTGALLQTANKSDVNLTFGAPSDHGIAQAVRPDSILSIDKVADLNATPDIELDLRRGGIEGHVGKLPPQSHYEVKFSNGVLGARDGAVFHLSAEGAVKVSSGQVVVVTITADGTPKTQVVGAGKEYNAATGTWGEISTSKPASETKSNADSPGAKGPLRKF